MGRRIDTSEYDIPRGDPPVREIDLTVLAVALLMAVIMIVFTLIVLGLQTEASEWRYELGRAFYRTPFPARFI